MILAQNRNFTWYNQAAHAPLATLTGATVSVPGCSPGVVYSVQWVNTTTGGTAPTGAHRVRQLGHGGEESPHPVAMEPRLSPATMAALGGAESPVNLKCTGAGALLIEAPEFEEDVAAIVRVQ